MRRQALIHEAGSPARLLRRTLAKPDVKGVKTRTFMFSAALSPSMDHDQDIGTLGQGRRPEYSKLFLYNHVSKMITTPWMRRDLALLPSLRLRIGQAWLKTHTNTQTQILPPLPQTIHISTTCPQLRKPILSTSTSRKQREVRLLPSIIIVIRLLQPL